MTTFSKRPFLLASIALVSLLSLIGLQACASPQTNSDGRKPYVTKIQLSLNVGAIPDPTTRNVAQKASRDIENTINALTDDRLIQREVESALQWQGTETLLLPPQNSGLETYKKQPWQKRWSFVMKRADDWKSTDANNISVLITLADIGDLAPDIHERQYYRYIGQRWRLIKQERQ